MRWDGSISILTMLWAGCMGNQGLISDRISYYTLHCHVQTDWGATCFLSSGYSGPSFWDVQWQVFV